LGYLEGRTHVLHSKGWPGLLVLVDEQEELHVDVSRQRPVGADADVAGEHVLAELAMRTRRQPPWLSDFLLQATVCYTGGERIDGRYGYRSTYSTNHGSLPAPGVHDDLVHEGRALQSGLSSVSDRGR
jgi:hypothetical protein